MKRPVKWSKEQHEKFRETMRLKREAKKAAGSLRDAALATRTRPPNHVVPTNRLPGPVRRGPVPIDDVGVEMRAGSEVAIVIGGRRIVVKATS